MDVGRIPFIGGESDVTVYREWHCQILSIWKICRCLPFLEYIASSHLKSTKKMLKEIRRRANIHVTKDE